MMGAANQGRCDRSPRTDLRSWLLTHDSKRIAILYVLSITLLFLASTAIALILGAEALTPKGDLLEPETFGRLFTLHGQLAVFFFLLPALPAVLGNFVLPMSLGARNVAFPRLNLVALYAFVAGGALILWSAVHGGLDSGWTLAYLGDGVRSSRAVRVPAVGALFGVTSAALVAANLIATVHRSRGLGGQMRFFVAGQYACAAVTLLVTPFFVTAIWLLLSGSGGTAGVDPSATLRYRALFWAYAHPALHAPLLVAIGIATEVLTNSLRASPARHGLVLCSMLAVALYGTLSLGQDLEQEVLGSYASTLSSLFGLLVAVPCLVIVLHWVVVIFQGPIRWTPPVIYATVFVLIFTTGGVTGIQLGVRGLGEHLRGTCYETAHFHYFVAGGTLSAFLAGLHYWWPKFSGRLYPESLARFAAVGLFLGLNLAFAPRFFLGYLGLPARSHDYAESAQLFQVLAFAGTTILVGALLLPIGYLTWSFFAGRLAEEDPWGSDGLEWRTTSPPPPPA